MFLQCISTVLYIKMYRNVVKSVTTTNELRVIFNSKLKRTSILIRNASSAI